MAEFDYPDEFLERVSEVFKAFSSTTRLKIIRELHREPRNVSQLHEAIGGSQANISRHLKTLLERGIVRRSREGSTTVYELADQKVTDICESTCDYLLDRWEKRRGLEE